ncbi:MAG: hypothetical protein M1475_00095 [Actinobacteria bacterium]|nr:hypothetical protein [Actinomycetota bacterium]
MELKVKNYKLGLATIITGYFAFAFYIFILFLSIEIIKNNVMTYSYIIIGSLLVVVLAAGILFLISLISNIKETKAMHKISKGMMLTLIAIPPIVLCYLALAVKALTEGH